MQNKYCLLKALKRTLIEDDNPIRHKDFLEIANRVFIIGLIYKFHKAIRPSWFSSLMIAAFGLKSLMAIKVQKSAADEILFTYEFPNEKPVADFINRCLKGKTIRSVEHGKRFTFSIRSFLIFCCFFFNLKGFCRYLRIIHRLNKRYHFMPACRAAGAICFYLRFRKELKDLKFKAVLVAKNYSPDCLALVWAARSLDLPSIYCAHAFTPPVKLKKPPLDFTLIILQGQRSLDILKALRAVNGEVIFRGITGQSNPLRLDNLKAGELKAGIFLTGNLNISGIKQTIHEINRQLNARQVLIRLHPVAIANADVQQIAGEFSNVKLTFGTPIAEDLAECDLVIVGNSTVTLEVLKGGIPCVYVDHLENVDFDYNGFVESRLIPYWKQGQALEIAEIKSFYSDGWNSIFKQYDAYYLSDKKAESEVGISLQKLLSRN